MRQHISTLFAQWSISMGLIGAGTYAITQGFSFAGAVAFGSTGVMNIELARILHYLSTTSIPQRGYQQGMADQRRADDDDRQDPPLNRRNDD